MSRRLLLDAALVGAASGLRSTVGVGALVDTRSSGIPAALTRPVGRLVGGAAVASELVVDKLPNTPSRLEPPGIASRILLASVAGAVLARAADGGVVPAVVVAATAAVVSAYVGHDVRARVSTHVPALAAAFGEDVVALALALLAARG